MQPPDAILEQGIPHLPTVGDGRQSGTSESPSILNASPEAAVGGGLAFLKTGDRVRLDAAIRRRALGVGRQRLGPSPGVGRGARAVWGAAAPRRPAVPHRRRTKANEKQGKGAQDGPRCSPPPAYPGPSTGDATAAHGVSASSQPTRTGKGQLSARKGVARKLETRVVARPRARCVRSHELSSRLRATARVRYTPTGTRAGSGTPLNGPRCSGAR